MAKSPQKRDNAYFMDRMMRERPDIHADYQAGKFKNQTEAFIAAGLIKPRSQLNHLQSAWAKATPTERDAFKVMIGCATASVAAVRPMNTGVTLANAPQPVRPGKRHLTPALENAIRTIMDQRGLTTGEIMRQIGEKPLNVSIGNALHQAWRVSDDLFFKLEKWVARYQPPRLP